MRLNHDFCAYASSISLSLSLSLASLSCSTWVLCGNGDGLSLIGYCYWLASREFLAFCLRFPLMSALMRFLRPRSSTDSPIVHTQYASVCVCVLLIYHNQSVRLAATAARASVGLTSPSCQAPLASAICFVLCFMRACLVVVLSNFQ